MRRSSSVWGGALGFAVRVAVVAITRSPAPPAPTRGSSSAPADLPPRGGTPFRGRAGAARRTRRGCSSGRSAGDRARAAGTAPASGCPRSEEHTSELQSHSDLVCRLLLEKKKKVQRQ